MMGQVATSRVIVQRKRGPLRAAATTTIVVPVWSALYIENVESFCLDLVGLSLDAWMTDSTNDKIRE